MSAAEDEAREARLARQRKAIRTVEIGLQTKAQALVAEGNAISPPLLDAIYDSVIETMSSYMPAIHRAYLRAIRDGIDEAQRAANGL